MRKAPWGALAGATAVGAVVAGFIAWQFQLQAINVRIEHKRSSLAKLVVSGRIPPTQEVMDYLMDRSAQLQERYRYWEALAIVPVPKAGVGGDSQLFFQERMHEVQRTLERLAAARGLATPEQLGFPKELPPSDTVPRLLVQLALIEDVVKVILGQGVTSVSSVKVDDPQTILEPDTQEPFLQRLPVRVRLVGRLPAVVKVVTALQHASPIIDLQGVRITTGPIPDELDVELVVSRYLLLAGPKAPVEAVATPSPNLAGGAARSEQG